MTVQLIDKTRSENSITKEIQDVYNYSDKQLTCKQKAIIQSKD
jgi:hypothetical protein